MHTKEFWDGTRQGKLMLPRCTNCNRVHWYPRLICPHCHSTELEWIEGSGEGRLHTFAVQHRAFGGWAAETPFVTAYIDLNEGDRMLTVLRGVDPTKPETIKIGSKCKVEFEAASRGCAHPVLARRGGTVDDAVTYFKAAAIVGAAEANEIGYPSTPKTSLQLGIEAIKNVSDQTGIPISRINGVFSAGLSSSELAEHLGLHPSYIDTTSVGGCSFEMHVHHALAAIYAGIIDVAVVVLGQAGWSAQRGGGGRGGRGGGVADNPGAQMTMAYGLSGAPSNYSHAMTRHNHRYGTTPEDFAHIAVVTREWATLNPRAVMHSRETHPQGGPITIEDVNQSRMISWPLTLLHCCLVTDYGGAVLVTSPEIAQSLRDEARVDGRRRREHEPLQHAGDGGLHGHFGRRLRRCGLQDGGHGAGRHGNGHDLRLLHDHRRHHRRDAGPGAEGRRLHPVEGRSRRAPAARLPINTNGGGLSFNHSGMYGMQLLVEAYRQLSGTAEDGINGIKGKQTKARSCIVNGTGGSLSTTGTLVLTAD